MDRKIDLQFKLVEIAAMLLVLSPRDKGRSEALDNAIAKLEGAVLQLRDKETEVAGS